MRTQATHKLRRRKTPRGLMPTTGSPGETADEPAPEQKAVFIEGDRLHTRLAERAYDLAEEPVFEPGAEVDDVPPGEEEAEREWASPADGNPTPCGD